MEHNRSELFMLILTSSIILAKLYIQFILIISISKKILKSMLSNYAIFETILWIVLANRSTITLIILFHYTLLHSRCGLNTHTEHMY